MNDLEDQMEPGEKDDITAKLNELREVAKGDDKAAIDEKVEALSESAQKLAERAYAAANQDTGDAAGPAPSDDTDAPADDAVDAEFEEVKDEKRQ